MADQAVLDLARADAVARRGDDVVVAADEGDIALLVDDALVAGRHPVADEFVARRFRLAPVFQEHHRIRPFDRDLAELAGLAHATVGADHRDGVPRHRLADRAGLSTPSAAQEPSTRLHSVWP